MNLLEQQFRKYPLQVGKHYRHDGKLRRNQKKTCPWLGQEVVVVEHLKSGLYQVRVINGRFSWFDPMEIYTLPKDEFLPIPGVVYNYPEDVTMVLTLKHIAGNSDLIYAATQTGFGALMPRDVDLQRVTMLMSSPDSEVFDHYFNSTWFPMARGGSVEGNMTAVENKVGTLTEADLTDFVKVVKSHWYFIEENFKWPLAYRFSDAVKLENELAQGVPLTKVMSPTEQHIEKLAKAINQLGPTHTAALIHQLDDVYGIDGQLGDLMRKLLEQAETSMRLPGPFLQIEIPEGATHYQDFTTAKDGGLRFYKQGVEGETLKLWVWALGRESGGVKWYPVQRLSMGNTPLIQLNRQTGVVP